MRTLGEHREEHGGTKGFLKGLNDGRKVGMQDGIKDGIRKSTQVGLVEGRTEGCRHALLLLLLRQGFGEIPCLVINQIRSADAAHLDEWLAHLITGPSLEDVFLTKKGH